MLTSRGPPARLGRRKGTRRDSGPAVDGRHLLRSSEYDLIVLDLGLPDGDGLALCREARRMRGGPDLVLTHATDSQQVEGLDSGARRLPHQAFDFPELAREYGRCAQGQRRSFADMQADDIRLDPSARTGVARCGHGAAHRARILTARIPHAAQGRS